MTLPVPQLDDRTFEQLVAEGRSLIPRYSATWTNHNPSDPGITLLELFAYLTETAIFQLDQVPAASADHFLRLVGICRDGATESIATAAGHAIATMQTPVRAVTADDFELLGRQAAAAAGAPQSRVRYVLGADPLCRTGEDEGSLAAPMALVVIVPNQPGQRRPAPDLALTKQVFSTLRHQRIVTTRLHVVGPTYTEVRIAATVVRKPGSGLTPVQVQATIVRFLDPLAGWFDGQGWPFGRPIFRSEMFQRLEGFPGVDHVATLTLQQLAGGVWATVEQVDLASPAGLVDAPAGNVTVTIEEAR